MKKSDQLISGIEVFLVTKTNVSTTGESIIIDGVEVLSSVNNELHYFNQEDLQHFYPILYNYN